MSDDTATEKFEILKQINELNIEIRKFMGDNPGKQPDQYINRLQVLTDRLSQIQNND